MANGQEDKPPVGPQKPNVSGNPDQFSGAGEQHNVLNPSYTSTDPVDIASAGAQSMGLSYLATMWPYGTMAAAVISLMKLFGIGPFKRRSSVGPGGGSGASLLNPELDEEGNLVEGAIGGWFGREGGRRWAGGDNGFNPAANTGAISNIIDALENFPKIIRPTWEGDYHPDVTGRILQGPTFMQLDSPAAGHHTGPIHYGQVFGGLGPDGVTPAIDAKGPDFGGNALGRRPPGQEGFNQAANDILLEAIKRSRFEGIRPETTSAIHASQASSPLGLFEEVAPIPRALDVRDLSTEGNPFLDSGNYTPEEAADEWFDTLIRQATQEFNRGGFQREFSPDEIRGQYIAAEEDRIRNDLFGQLDSTFNITQDNPPAGTPDFSSLFDDIRDDALENAFNLERGRAQQALGYSHSRGNLSDTGLQAANQGLLDQYDDVRGRLQGLADAAIGLNRDEILGVRRGVERDIRDFRLGDSPLTIDDIGQQRGSLIDEQRGSFGQDISDLSGDGLFDVLGAFQRGGQAQGQVSGIGGGRDRLLDNVSRQLGVHGERQRELRGLGRRGAGVF